MNQFDRAKAKYEKNRISQERALPKVEVEIKKERRDPPMTVVVTGPQELSFEIQYAGALLASQTTKEALVELFTKQLSAFGRVRCL